VKNVRLSKVALVISIVLIAAFLLSACDSPQPRIAASHYFNPGAPFQTNITVIDKDGNPDPRRQVRCALVFEVVDESAVEELTEVNFVVRNAVLIVIGELTIEEITVNRNLDLIIQRIVDRVNEDVNSNVPLIVWAYFTDFALV